MKLLFRYILILSFVSFFGAYTAAQDETPAVNQTAASTAVPIAMPGQTREDEAYRIGYQDTLEVQVFGHPKLTQRVGVNPNGTVNLFRLPQPVPVVCKTVRELSNDIAVAYEKDYLRDPEVNVVVVEQRSQSFAVIGAVEKPGTYFINRKIRLLELLAQAGGPSKDAGSRIVVARTGSTSDCKVSPASGIEDDEIALMDFKMSEVLQAKQDLVMKPGDIVSVLDADVVYIYGNVIKQGQVEIKEPITLTQAIASAEGLKPATKKDNIRIYRQRPGSMERDEFVYDLSEIEKRTVQDPYLQPNDVVAVSEDKIKSIFNSIKTGLTQGIPSMFYMIP